MASRNNNGLRLSAKIDGFINYLKKSNQQTQALIWQFEREGQRDRAENQRIHEELKENIVELKANTVELKANTVELKANVADIKANTAELKANVDELKEFNREQVKLNAIFAKAILKKLLTGSTIVVKC